MRRFFYLLLFFAAANTSHAKDEAVLLKKGTDIVEAWSTEQHLYVKGEVRLNERQKAELEKWLDENAVNWTVMVMDSARNERFHGKRGIDAVEARMESELLGSTKFGELRSPNTGDLWGAFFIIYLKERSFSYFGNEHYEDRGLGGTRFAGKLDSAAIRALRNGGRVADAIRGTILLIDGKVEQKLLQQKNALKKAEEAKRARKNKLIIFINNTQKELATFIEILSEFRENENTLVGDLAQTDVEIWSKSIHQATLLWSQSEWDAARRITQTTHDEFSAIQHLLENYHPTRLRLEEIEQEIKAISVHPAYKMGKQQLAHLVKQMKEAKKAHQDGQSYYESRVQKLNQALVSFVQSNRFAAENHEIELAQMRADKERKKTMFKVAGSTTGGLLLIGAIMGNRRRRGVKTKAEALLKQRREEMSAVSNELMDLIDWAALVTGPMNELEQRGYEGETLATSKRGLAAVDQAFVMSSHVQDLIKKGSNLIEPGNPVGGMRNLVSQGAYEEAIELLDSEVICQPGSPPPLPDSAQARKLERLGSGDGEDFLLELPLWQAKLQASLQEGRSALEEVDQAWSTIVARREDLQSGITQLKHLEGKIDDWSADNWLQLDTLFENWIPKMEEKLMQGTELAKGDPVAALNGPILRGDEMAYEAKTMITGVVTFREKCWSSILEQERNLERLGHHTIWIDREMDHFTNRGETICETGCEKPVKNEVTELSTHLLTFAERVGNSHVEAVRAEKQVKPALASATQLVAQTRESLGRKLQVESSLVLSENEGRNPDEHLEEARAKREAALTALNDGEAISARNFLNEADLLEASARALVKESEEIFRSFPQRHRELTTAHHKADQHSDLTETLVDSLRRNYASSALVVNLEKSDGPSYAHAPLLLKKTSNEVSDHLSKGQQSYQNAQLLEARLHLNISEEGISDREKLCTEIETRRDELDTLEKENDLSLATLQRKCSDLVEPIGDRRVMEATVTLFTQLRAEEDLTAKATNAEGTAQNPYQAAALLADLNERVVVVAQELKNDISIYESTILSLKQTQSAEAKGQKFVRTAQNDGIADSGRLQKAMSHVETSSKQLANIQITLQSDHGDWRLASNELSETRTELARATIAIREELQLAREAMTSIAQAEKQIRAATNWRGRYGVRVNGTPGLREIESANHAVLSGNYNECIRYAGAAIADARRAIAAAEAEEARKRRQAEAAQRARAAASRRTRMSSSSSFRSSSRRSSSRSSRVGRSSASSSSRVGRSGW